MRHGRANKCAMRQPIEISIINKAGSAARQPVFFIPQR
jgi:hypothetical protein